MNSYRGKILVAAPTLFDFFRRSIVLIVEHSDEGAFGLVLNRRSETSVGEAMPPLAEIADPGDPVYVGGPVGSNSIVILGEFENPEDSAKIVVGRVGIVDPEDLKPPLGRARVFAGHAGWGPGQLDREVEDEAWLIAEAEPEYVFFRDDLWAEVLGSRGGQWALLSTMPDDPSLN